jgi:hypothetical protein
MAGPWEKYQAPPTPPSGNTGPWAKYQGTPASAAPDEIVQAMPDSMSGFDMNGLKGLYHRAVVKNLSNNPGSAVNYLKDQYPHMEVKQSDDGQILLREPGKNAWNVLDPQTGIDWKHPTEIGKDLLDAGYDVGSGVASGAASAAGGIAGGVAGAPTVVGAPIAATAGAMGAGAATSAGLEALRQKLGNALGIKQDLNGKQVAVQGAIGAAAPLLFGTGGAAKPAMTAAADAGLNEAEQLAVAQAQRGLISRAASAMKGSAETAAFKTLGPYAKQAQQVYGKDQVQEMGRQLMDEGIVNGVPKSYETLAKETGAAAEQHGGELGKIITELDKAGPAVSRSSVADETAKVLQLDPGIPGNIEKNAEANVFAQKFKDLGGELPGADLTISEAEKLKRAVGKQVNWERPYGADIPEAEKPLRALYSSLKRGSESAADTAADTVGGTTKTQFKEAKRIYGLLADANRIANGRAGKEIANRLISPSDYMSGAAGMIAGAGTGHDVASSLGNGAIGITLGAINKFGRTYGNQMLAPALDNTGNLLLRAGQLPPGISQSAWTLLNKRNGE